MRKRALRGANIFDGTTLHAGKSVLLDGAIVRGIVSPGEIPADFDIVELDGGTLLPGFVDLQVNGGGGVMFNDVTSPDGVAAIAEAHATTGTRALLPTLITDTPAKTRAAVDAVADAIRRGVPGILGIHLEGPHLSLARKGAHDPSLIRPMEEEDAAFLCATAGRLPNLMVTVAPENVTTAQIARLTEAGVIVSLGHTDCDLAAAEAAFSAGARCVTHLFNAMSQMGNREPGLVGATLATPGISAGLIADGIHVHAASIRVALSSKRPPGSIFLVTDAMSTVGSDIAEFTLNGRRVIRRDGRLTLADGTLAGADLDFPTAISVLVERVGVTVGTALAMATSAPASVLRDARGFGAIRKDAPWNGIHLDGMGRYRDLAWI
ncbi:N-acetylglucosamine-6-phosphate deacetylase [Defluviimonas sp. WL0024]|uniref:N-acetylglucosamine-6-phosphate deacetylase n=1 Tax=Albidovulum salinarum TaxID=2984153 RepID=A0ABT2XEF8_9RHOB|nr:N-acetylglucosamine-6-phosphate deacetylase [Defluviimonas sp. WL0024]MCU9850075.1 N-acetylglucosamine-6-phosphate deacetylase [Defluviimonas sp. WL0024]